MSKRGDIKCESEEYEIPDKGENEENFIEAEVDERLFQYDVHENPNIFATLFFAMQRMKLSTSGISPTRVDYQLRSMEESNSALTSRLSLVEGTVKTQESLLHDMFSQLRNARGDNKNLQNVAIRANTDIENIRRQAEAERNNMAAEYTRQLHMLTEQKQRELSEQTNSMIQQFKEEEHSQMVNHKSELEQAQRQSDVVKARELSTQADQARRDKESLKQDLNQRHALELQKTIQEYEGSLTAVKTELGATKATSIQKENEHALKMKAMQADIAKRDQMIAQLKHEAVKQQATLTQLLASMEDQTAELVQLKSETKRNIRLFLEDQLHEKTERRMDAVRADHEHELEELVKQQTTDTDTYNKHLAELQMRLSDAEERYENRDSLQQDLDEIERLRACLHEEGEKNAVLNMQVQTLTEQLEEYNATPEPQQDGVAHQYPPQVNIPSHIQQSYNGYYPGSPMRRYTPRQPVYNGMSGVGGDFYQSGVRDEDYICDENLIQQLQYDQRVGPHGNSPMPYLHMQQTRGINQNPYQPTPRHIVHHHVDPAIQQPVAVIQPTDTDACTAHHELNLEQQQQQQQQRHHQMEIRHSMTQTTPADTAAPGITSHTDETDAGGGGVSSNEVDRSEDASTVLVTSARQPQQQTGGSLDCPQESSGDLQVVTSQTTGTLVEDTGKPGCQVSDEQIEELEALQETDRELEESNRTQTDSAREQIETRNQEPRSQVGEEHMEHMEALQKTIGELKEINISQTGTIEALKQEKARVEEALSCSIARCAGWEKDVNEHIWTIKEQIESQEHIRAEEIAALQEELSNQKVMQHMQEKAFQELMTKTTTWETEEQALKQQVECLENEKTKIEEQLSVWKSKTEDMKEKCELRLKEIEMQNENVQRVQAEETATLQQDIKSLGAINQSRNDSVQQLQLKIKDLEQKQKQGEIVQRNLNALETERERMKTDLAKLKSDSEMEQMKLKSEIDILSSELKSQRAAQVKDKQLQEQYQIKHNKGTEELHTLISMKDEELKKQHNISDTLQMRIEHLETRNNVEKPFETDEAFDRNTLNTQMPKEESDSEKETYCSAESTENISENMSSASHERNADDLDQDICETETKPCPDINTCVGIDSEEENEPLPAQDSAVQIPTDTNDRLSKDIQESKFEIDDTYVESIETESNEFRKSEDVLSETHPPVSVEKRSKGNVNDTNGRTLSSAAEDTDTHEILPKSNMVKTVNDDIHTKTPERVENTSITDGSGKTDANSDSEKIQDLDDDVAKSDQTHGENTEVKETSPDQDVGKSLTIDATKEDNFSIADNAEKKDNQNDSDKVQGFDDKITKIHQPQVEGIAVDETSSDKVEVKSSNNDDSKLFDVHIKNPELFENKSIAHGYEIPKHESDSKKDQYIDDTFTKEDQTQEEVTTVENNSTRQDEVESSTNDDSKLLDLHSKPPKRVENLNADERPEHLLDDNISQESKQMLKATDKTSRTNTSFTIRCDRKDKYSEYASCNYGEQLSGSNASDQGEKTLPSAAGYTGKTETTTDPETLMNADENAIVEKSKQFATLTDNEENDVPEFQEHIKQEDCKVFTDTSGHVDNLNKETMDEQPADIDFKPEAEMKSSLPAKRKDIHTSQPCTNDDADETQNLKSVHEDKKKHFEVSETKQSVQPQPQDMAENMTSVELNDNDNVQIAQLNYNKNSENMAFGRNKQKCNLGSENKEILPHNTVDEDQENNEPTGSTPPVTETGDKETGSTPHVTETGDKETVTTPPVTEMGDKETGSTPYVTETGDKETVTTPPVTETGDKETVTTPPVTETGDTETVTTPHVTETGDKETGTTPPVTETGDKETETTPPVTETGDKETGTTPPVTETGDKETVTTPPVTETGDKETGSTPHVTETGDKETGTTPPVTETGDKETVTTPPVTETGDKETVTTPPVTETGDKETGSTPHVTETGDKETGTTPPVTETGDKETVTTPPVTETGDKETVTTPPVTETGDKETGTTPPVTETGDKETGTTPPVTETGDKETGTTPPVTETGDKETGTTPPVTETGDKETGTTPPVTETGDKETGTTPLVTETGDKETGSAPVEDTDKDDKGTDRAGCVKLEQEQGAGKVYNQDASAESERKTLSKAHAKETATDSSASGQNKADTDIVKDKKWQPNPKQSKRGKRKSRNQKKSTK